MSKPEILANARGVGHDVRIGAEQLRRDGMLFRLEGQIARQRSVRLLGSCRRPEARAHPVRARKFGHNKTASAEIADEAPENGVGDAGHGGEHRRGRDGNVPDVEIDSGNSHNQFSVQIMR